MIDSLIKNYRIKGRKIVNIIMQPDRKALQVATVSDDVDVQWEFHFVGEFVGEQVVDKKLVTKRTSC